MKTIAKTIACLVAGLAIAAFAQAEEEKHLELILAGDAEAGLITIKTDDLAPGESRTFTSENGRPVVLSRTESGLEIDVDGKKTQVDLPEAGGEGFAYEIRDEEDNAGGDAERERRIIIKKLGEGASVNVIDASGNTIKVHETSADAGHQIHKEVRVIRLGGEGEEPGNGAKKIHVIVGDSGQGHGGMAAARAKLISSGALDGLDEATREKILAALGDGK